MGSLCSLYVGECVFSVWINGSCEVAFVWFGAADTSSGLHILLYVLCVFVKFKYTIGKPSLFSLCGSWVGARRLDLALICYLSPANRLALRTFSSDWTKFLWKATRACGWHKVISRFTVTLKWYATCRTVNSTLPVTDRNWPGWGPAKWVFQLMRASAAKRKGWRGIRISGSWDCFM